jgi:hypothetical protein
MSSETAVQLQFPFGCSEISQAREEPKVGETLKHGNHEWPVIAVQTDANGNTIVTIGPKIGSRNGKTHVTARSPEDHGLLLDEIRLDFRRSIDVRARVIEAGVVTPDVQAGNSRARAEARRLRGEALGVGAVSGPPQTQRSATKLRPWRIRWWRFASPLGDAAGAHGLLRRRAVASR